jgi:hypothetical protein
MKLDAAHQSVVWRRAGRVFQLEANDAERPDGQMIFENLRRFAPRTFLARVNPPRCFTLTRGSRIFSSS